MGEKPLEIYAIGHIASEILSVNEIAYIQGFSSRGIFLQLRSRWILFISFEKYHGPFSLNYRGDRNIFNNVEIGSPIYIKSGILEFPSLDLSVPFYEAQVWTPPAPFHRLQPRDQRWKYLAAVHLLQAESIFLEPISDLLPMVLGLLVESDSRISPYQSKMNLLQSGCESGDIQSIAQGLSSFLGLGSGLTPSGDDLVTGYLLGINRWGKFTNASMNIEQLNSRIVHQAREKTNLISSNMIESACLGFADERLVLALDGIMTGKIKPQECVDLLSRWGNTSGFDSLIGMALFSFTQTD